MKGSIYLKVCAVFFVLLGGISIFMTACGNSSPTSSSGPTATPAPPAPTNTPGLTFTFTNTATVTATYTITNTPTATISSTSTYTPTGTYTNTATSTPTRTFTGTATNSPTISNTPTASDTSTITNTATTTFTKTVTNTVTMTATLTETPCQTPGTFGNSTVGNTVAFSEVTEYYMSNFTVPAGGSPHVRDIQVYMSSVGGGLAQVGLYPAVSGSPSGQTAVALLSQNISTGGAYGWQIFYVTGSPAVTPGSAYSIVVLFQSGSDLSIGNPSGGTNFYSGLTSSLVSPFSGTPNGAYSDAINAYVDYCK